MPRQPRQHSAGVCFHVINRGNNRQQLFRKPEDYAAFVAILTDALSKFEIDLLCWCLMSNHWHLVLRPRTDKAMAEFMRWLTLTHVRRHHKHYEIENGHLYQGRYKSFPVEEDDYFLNLCRYVESNALRAGLVTRAEAWEWSSLWQRSKRATKPALAEWPVNRPDRWTAVVNESMPEDLSKEIKQSILRDRPLGSAKWLKQIAKKLRLEQKLNPVGRPRKPDNELSRAQRYRRKREAAATTAAKTVA